MKIRDAELDQIYAYDASLVADVDLLSDAPRAGGRAAPDGAALAAPAKTADELDLKIARRREIFEKPTA